MEKASLAKVIVINEESPWI